jgi:putative endonuclease
MSFKKNQVTLGKEGERAAETYLKQCGYQILERNVRASFGEIDLVAKEGGALVFIEIKARGSIRYGFPEESVTEKKKRQLIQLADWYLMRFGSNPPAARFDVVSILFLPMGPRIQLFRDAFEISVYNKL